MNEKQILDKLKAVSQNEEDKVISLTEIGLSENNEQKVIKHLVVQRKIYLLDPDHVVLTTDANNLKGVFKGTDKGFGFVDLDGVEFSVFIPPSKTRYALTGDEVAIVITTSADLDSNRGATGFVGKIIHRTKTEIIGEYIPTTDPKRLAQGYVGCLRPLDNKLSKIPLYLRDPNEEIKLHDIVVATITDYPSRKHPDSFTGVKKEVLGSKDAPGIDVLSVLKGYDLPLEFPDDVQKQINQVPDEVQDNDRACRKDLTDEIVVTIDGDDSKDFDDAVGLKQLENGHYLLGVHIADVASYVHEGSALDQEAYKRGTSTYLVGEVVPMLPFKLSNGICSLNPDVDRLTMTCEMEIDGDGKVLNHQIFPSVIRSKGRLTYNLVNDTFEGKKVPDNYEKLRSTLEKMRDLHLILNEMRIKRGAIEFEEREPQIVLDQQGHPVDIKIRERKDAEKMIESFMLAANETVAKDYYDRHLPFLYRVHEVPDEEKISDFLTFANTLGLKRTPGLDPKSPKVMQSILEQAKGTNDEQIVITKMLRSMKQAHYAREPLGHYGIGAKYYSHFTSPIRRYPDLISHRLIHEYLTRKDELMAKPQELSDKIDAIADQSSVRERVSVDVERDVLDLKKAEYMADKIGQVFDGVIGSAVSFGLFISLPNTVEGLVHISTLKDDYYNFSEDLLALVGEKSRKMYRVGQPVRVKLVNVNVDLHQVDFELTSDNQGVPAPEFEGVSDFTHSEGRHFIKANEKEKS
ncbi:ribonuclease R [Xylocopilactobacillus apis]|uniref:Ribonuclease R n=1 Tax=Xylocopilactobacillus apis TaxID=2932183 RepID=A0AAU9CZ68_9LACO|nr:ribonuclease R [Xylocopilactobacillus apis]BDR56724.1 ribonuclease R [Xylocopilactobacillus apis]